jgi:hypothetical protein
MMGSPFHKGGLRMNLERQVAARLRDLADRLDRGEFMAKEMNEREEWADGGMTKEITISVCLKGLRFQV